MQEVKEAILRPCHSCGYVGEPTIDFDFYYGGPKCAGPGCGVDVIDEPIHPARIAFDSKHSA